MRPFFLSIIALLSWAQCEANNRFGTPSGQCEPCVECFDDNLLTWTIYPTQYNFVKVDSSIVYNNRHPLKISTLHDLFALHGYFFKRILLPDVFADTIQVQVNSKSKNIGYAKLLVDRISSDEKIFFTDTMSINVNDTSWCTTSYKLPASGMKFMGLRLLIYEMNKVEKIFWLDQLTILLDGKPINEFPSPTIHPFSVSDPESMKKLSFNKNLYDHIEELKVKKIIALGETVHGSGSINRATSQIIKHQVLNNGCKLVLLEIPFEIMMFFNKEVQGEVICKGDSVLKSSNPLFDLPILDDLIKWLTQYNKENPDNMVTLMGTDIHPLEEENRKLLSEYVTCLNRTINSQALNDFSEVLSRKLDFREPNRALAYLNERPELKEALQPTDYLMIKHNLEMSLKATPITPARLDRRDVIMKDNAIFLIDLFAPENETVTIWTHFGHANYTKDHSDLPHPSFGSYMKELYKDGYGCLGITIGGGGVNAVTMDITPTTVDITRANKEVAPPLQCSMEYYFNLQPEEYIYCSSDNFNDALSYIRRIGQPYYCKKLVGDSRTKHHEALCH